MYTMSQQRQLTARIFGVYDPYNPDNSLNKLESKYREHTLKVIHEIMIKYMKDKFNYLLEFMDPETINNVVNVANVKYDLWKWKDYRKKYYEKNKEKITQQQKESSQRNYEKIAERKKIYRDTHKEQLFEKSKLYVQTHRDQINERKREKITCECGSIVSKSHVWEHKLTIKHKEYLKSLPQ